MLETPEITKDRLRELRVDRLTSTLRFEDTVDIAKKSYYHDEDFYMYTHGLNL